MAVFNEGGRCFVMSLLVRPVHVDKNPAFFCFDPCCNHRAETNPVVPDSEVLLAVYC